MRELVLRSGDVEALQLLADRVPHDADLQAAAVAALPAGDGRRSWAAACLARAERP